MELYRKIYKKLIEWKENDKGKSSILIEGAGRIGKSTIAEKFGKENYKSYILVDLSIAPKSVLDNFENNLNNLDIFYQTLSLEYNTRLYNRDTLIIFDEIQKYPKAREATRHLVKDGRYDILSTGSLISIKENVENIVIPSEEKKIKMYPLDFEEFLIADGEEVMIDYIKHCWQKEIPLENRYHKKAMRLFEEYIIVGGMPQSVVAFFENGRDFYQAYEEKQKILELYRDDIRKASKKYNSKVSAIFENIPAYLSTHEKKVVLRKIKGNSFSEYDEPLFWLGDSMICNLCYKCTDPNVGFNLNKDDSAVKCYMGDTGLLLNLAFSDNEIASQNLYKQIINGKLSINKGMFYENVVAQELAAQGRQLYFYTHYSEEKKRNDIEIDFMLSNESKTNIKVYPIEAKSSKNYTNIYYDKFKERFGKRIGESYIVHPKSFIKNNDEKRLPAYMIFCMFN